MQRSKFGRINLRDLGKGILVGAGSAAFAAIISYFQVAMQAQDFVLTSDTFIFALMAGLSAGLSYLMKNLFEDREGVLGGRA